MGRTKRSSFWTRLAVVIVITACGATVDARETAKPSSYAPVDIKEDFSAVMEWMKEARPGVMARQMELLKERYDLADRPARGVTMSRGKAVQEGGRVRLPGGVTWEKLATMSPDEPSPCAASRIRPPIFTMTDC